MKHFREVTCKSCGGKGKSKELLFPRLSSKVAYFKRFKRNCSDCKGAGVQTIIANGPSTNYVKLVRQQEKQRRNKLV